jgi:hypothetical protein
VIERRVSRVLGISSDEASLLFAGARARLGKRALALRAAAFVAATMPVLRPAMPLRVRRAALRPLVYALFPGLSEKLLYAGLGAAPRRAGGP